MSDTRLEKDSLGQRELPVDVLYGINSDRARDNFIVSGISQNIIFYKALAKVKLACAKTNLDLEYLSENIGNAVIQAITEIIAGKHFEFFIVDPLQGGAGTSENMNINEIIANRAMQISGIKVDPIEHVNLHQSTNDVYPTALKIAVYDYLVLLEDSTNKLLQGFQEKEKEFSMVLKLGRTQLMPAVPITLGREFSAYSDVIARDRWRIFKSMERIRQVNLGGTAIGTGLTAPKKYILKVNKHLREITTYPIARSENLVDATQNHDQIAEVFGMIKTFALNLEKISDDLRLMTSFGEINLPKVQTGSSVMPGKYNPVICEMVSSIAKKVQGNELVSSLAVSSGELELNAFTPLIKQTFLESLDILNQAVIKFSEKCIKGITANDKKCRESLFLSPTIVTVLIPDIGYNKASEIAEYMKNMGVDFYEASNKIASINRETIDTLLSPERINTLGYDK